MGALDRVFRGRRGGQERPVAAIVAGMWKNGEQGLWYDPSGFRDAWNNVGPELTPTTASVFGEASVISPGVYRLYSSAGAFSGINAATTGSTVVGKKYILRFTVDSITTLGSGLTIESAENPTVTTIGPKVFVVTTVNASLFIKRSAACDIQISSISVREWLGKPSCPLYQDSLGSLPVYLPGQGQVDPPVGLVLDESRGFICGPELISNTSFATLTGWTAVRGASASVSGGVVTVTTADPNNWGSVSTPISTIPGRTYLVSTVATVTGGQSAQILISEHPSNHVGIFNSAGNASIGLRSFIFKATQSVYYVWLGSAGNAAGVAISSWAQPSVREVSANYAIQPTTTSRPTLSARYNLLTNTDSLSSGWSTFNGALALEGAYWKFTENTSNSLHSFLQTPSQTKAASYRASFVGKPAGRSIVRFVLNAYSGNFCEVRFNLASGTVTAVFTGGDGVVESYSIVPVGDGAYRCTIVGKPSAAAAGTAFDVSLGMMADGATPTYLGDGVSGILVNNFDCRSSTDGAGLPSYQKVVDANTYDTVGFPLYLNFDGVDDWLQTTSVDFSSATAVSAFAAVRKLSDASRGVIVELGASGYGAPDSFNIEQAWFSPNFSASYSGSAGSATTTKPGIASPASAVLSAVFDRTAPVVRLRYQGQEASQNSAAVGAGTFLNAVVYVARRGGASSPAKVRLYGLVIRAGSIANSQISAVEKLLNQIARAY